MIGTGKRKTELFCFLLASQVEIEIEIKIHPCSTVAAAIYQYYIKNVF